MTQRRAALREAKSLAWLAWPLIIGNLGNVAIQVTDTMMIGRVGPTSLAAVALAAHLSLVISLLLHRHGGGSDTLGRPGARARSWE